MKMDRKEAAFYLGGLRTEFPRLEFPVSVGCTQERREEARGQVMEALEMAIRVLGDLGGKDKAVLHEH